jgi:plasmid stability protein
MEKQAHDIEYTIRGVPPDVDRALRRRAAQRKQSLNDTVIEELRAAMLSSSKRADFGDLVGRWTPDPAFDEAISAQRQIDPDKWK